MKAFDFRQLRSWGLLRPLPHIQPRLQPPQPPPPAPRQFGYLLTLSSDSLTDSGTHVLDALRLDIPRYLLSVPTDNPPPTLANKILSGLL